MATKHALHGVTHSDDLFSKLGSLYYLFFTFAKICGESTDTASFSPFCPRGSPPIVVLPMCHYIITQHIKLIYGG